MESHFFISRVSPAIDLLPRCRHISSSSGHLLPSLFLPCYRRSGGHYRRAVLWKVVATHSSSSQKEVALADDNSLATYARKAPVTGERKLNLKLQDEVKEPYLARALVAVDKNHPRGTVGKDPRDMSVLQQHVAFFDRNDDGIVYPWETFIGCRAIGCGFILSLLLAFIINLGLSYSTLPSWIPNPLLPIYIKNIHKSKHGSDSETYDTEGRFVPAKFDAIFSKYAKTYPNALTLKEIFNMLEGNRDLLDFFGGFAALMEWGLLYVLAKDENGLLQGEDVRGVFDGSLFERLEQKTASRSKRA